MPETKRPTGKVQRLILDELDLAIADKGTSRAIVSSDDLARRLRAVDLGLDAGADLPPGDRPSRSDYVSVCRAARELARRGLVSIDRQAHWGGRSRAAILWVAPPGVIEDGRRPGLAETLSNQVVEIVSGALKEFPPGPGSRCPAGHVHYWRLHRYLRALAGDTCGQFRKQITRAIERAEERGEIVVVRYLGETGYASRRVPYFVALSSMWETRQQTDETARSPR
jgi:hypothetical protein